MKNIFLFCTLFFTMSLFSQNSTERWNSNLNRYEYFNNYGNLTGYKTYNSYNQTWEYYKVDSYNYENQVKSAINIDLIDSALNAKQQRYDNNLRNVRSVVDVIYNSFKKEATSYVVGEVCKYRFNKEYLSNISGKPYDFSSNSVTNSVILYLINGAELIKKQELAK